MDYCFEADNWGASFSFPWAAAGRYIKSCSEIQIKVLLCALAGGRFTNSSVLAEAAGCDEADVDAAVEYWQSVGVLRVNGEIKRPVISANDQPHVFSGKQEAVSLVEAVKPTRTPVEKKVTVRYSQREMHQKTENDAALKNLINEIQSLQFSINGSELAKLIELYELYKFDAASIMLAADNCRAAGKCSIAYLHTMMVNWYNEGIVSYADVENAIIRSAERKAFENKVLKLFGMENRPSKKQRAFIEEWEKQGQNTELIEIAYNKCLDMKGKLSFSYINAILSNWAGSGITTSEQVEKADADHRNKVNASNGGEKSSYDLDAYESFAMNYDLSDAAWNNRKDDK